LDFPALLEPGPVRLNMTVVELHAMLDRFKKLFEDSTLAKYIILAGGCALIPKTASGWPTLSGLVFERVGPFCGSVFH